MHQLTANHRPCGVTVTGWPEESQLMTSDDILRIARAVKQMAINQSRAPMAFGSTRRWVMEVKAKTKRDSGLRLALLDRLDVLDLPSRSQALTLLRAVTMDKEIDSVIVAGTLKEPMAKTPAWLQAVWIDAGQLADQQQQAAA